MRIGILTRNQDSWCGIRLRKAFQDNHVNVIPFSFQDLVTQIGIMPKVSLHEKDLASDLSAILVRPIGRGSLDEIIFQLGILHTLRDAELPVVNNPAAIERAVDKYRALEILRSSGIPVPKTIVTENAEEASKAFKRFGCEAIVKPVFGSRGIGAARISDEDIAERIFRTLRFYKHVLYIQEFIPHSTSDIRAFVINDEVVAAMKRESKSWKKNVSRGAKPIRFDPTEDLRKMVVKASRVLGCEISGVDVIESEKGFVINEVNSQPGWRGLQSTTKIDIASKIADYVILKAKLNS